VLTVADLDLVAGHLALDFVNTVDDRIGNVDDVLRDAGDLAAWGVRAGVLTGGAWIDAVGSAEASAEWTAAVRLRGAVGAVVEAVVRARPLPTADVVRLADEVSLAYADGELVLDPDLAATQQTRTLRWRWSARSLSSVRHVVAVTAVDLLAGPDVSRIGECPGEACGWFFLDATKRHNRRWCSMRECGQAAKSARRRAARGAVSG
jgi:predicted RNA-binding Zn ribbon-like protein